MHCKFWDNYPGGAGFALKKVAKSDNFCGVFADGYVGVCVVAVVMVVSVLAVVIRLVVYTVRPLLLVLRACSSTHRCDSGWCNGAHGGCRTGNICGGGDMRSRCGGSRAGRGWS